MADFFTNRSGELVGGGDTLYTPNLTEMGANSKSNGVAVTLFDLLGVSIGQLMCYN
jgi:hypothetical protein